MDGSIVVEAFELVFLRKPDAKTEKGIRDHRAIALGAFSRKGWEGRRDFTGKR